MVLVSAIAPASRVDKMLSASEARRGFLHHIFRERIDF